MSILLTLLLFTCACICVCACVRVFVFGVVIHCSNAAAYGHYRCVGALLAAGATVDPKSTEGVTPLRFAFVNCKYHTTRMAAFRFCALLLLDHGARIERTVIKAGDYSHVPQYAVDFVSGRERCRRAALAVFASRRLGRSPVLAGNGVDIARSLARLVWRSRFDGAWAEAAQRASSIY